MASFGKPTATTRSLISAVSVSGLVHHGVSDPGSTKANDIDKSTGIGVGL